MSRGAFRARDGADVEGLIRRFGPMVLSIAEAFAVDADHAEDLFQETWKQVCERIDTYHERGSMEAWLHRIATNVCRTDHRNRAARRAIDDRLALDGTAHEWVWRPLGPLAQTERSEFRRRLHLGLAALPEREHRAVALRVLEGRPAQEVARMMGVKPSTVRSLIRHAITRLRNGMEAHDDRLSRHESSR
jgi:RNA polymerase sigma-70 factor (ECF subfamily)